MDARARDRSFSFSTVFSVSQLSLALISTSHMEHSKELSIFNFVGCKRFNLLQLRVCRLLLSGSCQRCNLGLVSEESRARLDSFYDLQVNLVA